MDEASIRKLTNLIGLGVRGRLVVVGVEQVRSAAARGSLELAIVAPDVSRHSKEKVLPLLHAKGIQVVEGPPAASLGAAVGRETTAAVGVVDKQLARGIRALVGTGAAEPTTGARRERIRRSV
jgi:ribosomal protein L7Ae-like RNA K-turn-binding protein